MYKNKIILSIVITISIVATILGIVSIAKKISWGIYSSSIFNVITTDLPQSIISHLNATKVIGIIALIIGLASGSLAGYLLFRENQGLDPEMRMIITISSIAILSLIFGIIAMAFNDNLNDPMWLAKKFLGWSQLSNLIH